jgi:hypothetical protein
MLHLMVRKEKKIYIYIYIEHEAHVLRGRGLKEKVAILLLDCYVDMIYNKTKYNKQWLYQQMNAMVSPEKEN